ncbi:DUF1496 domain-containing protein [uncultured Shimia sp.]|uniref:DUF1496 domain-containing protein n=1 Tax=uncultured Shimia sp. TaxID=573152 RepID=UPI003451BE20
MNRINFAFASSLCLVSFASAESSDKHLAAACWYEDMKYSEGAEFVDGAVWLKCVGQNNWTVMKDYCVSGGKTYSQCAVIPVTNGNYFCKGGKWEWGNGSGNC